MSDPIRIRAMVRDGGVGEIRTLLPHPMESGQRRAPSGDLIPAHYIETLTIALNGREIIRGRLGPAVSANPLFVFHIDGVKAGDKVRIAWQDNQGGSRSDEAAFA
ncbi:thiosulfate oxidation carrier complex protein SoxZ [Pseudothauera rhizosphaerae]|uniref:Thiosulfate oxidation carrier complex protein SoxZ n=1 Tax=Pseudothauera rhizosphaerae TaxID=2565932 RepID=A0A4S4AAF9_9RHOO|nr:thiosulfate oxidation carrier complex protein SoxZ [Pseudothauera rhizosphaerae]THF55611.1 thiosulfate oxidation carrier complex protein SoxZ [Pseudothauera rhizosphaerae]